MCHLMNKSNKEQKEQTKNYSFFLQQNLLPLANNEGRSHDNSYDLSKTN